MNACMIPQTVPNRPTYGDTEPTEARNDRFDSMVSSSRWKLARMARRAPSSSAPESVTRRSRSFMNSRMPEANMRSIGADEVLRLVASSYRSLSDTSTSGFTPSSPPHRRGQDEAPTQRVRAASTSWL